MRTTLLCVATVGALTAGQPASAGELAGKAVHIVYHRFFDEMMRKGFDCVRDFEGCKAAADPARSPPLNLSREEIDLIKRSFVQRETEPVPPQFRVVPADNDRRPR